MSLLIKDNEPSQAEWNRKARDAANGLIRRLAGCGRWRMSPARPYAWPEQTGRAMLQRRRAIPARRPMAPIAVAKIGI